MIILIPLLIAVLLITLFSCTLSVTTIHTQGEAADIVDEQQTTTPQVSTAVHLPIPIAG